MSNWRDPTENDLGPQELTRGSISKRESSRKQLPGGKNSNPNTTSSLFPLVLLLLNTFLSCYLVIGLSSTGGKLEFVQYQLQQIHDNVNREVLNAGDSLNKGQQLTSNNKCFTLTLQLDGNLVLYNNKQESSLWSSGTSQRNSSHAIMQPDGNFVIYSDGGSAVWASNTNTSGGSQLKVENDGNVVIYTRENKRVWETGTGGQSCS
ncbi:MAG: hypothetical protein HC899_00935 [Leptolyngbyaceae cyanobacterium SM1_4_3]|nr:hypothetical protein [Leptolyngbyaceae cyanobacterium SM1_4_3]